MGKENDLKWSTNSPGFWPVLFGFLTPVVVWIAFWVACIFAMSGTNALQERGQFGDMFGAINALFTGISTVAILFVYWQIRVSYSEMEKDHERARRQKAIELMQFWTTSANDLTAQSALIRRFVESLDRAELLSLAELRPFSLDQRFKDEINACLAAYHVPELKAKDGKVELDAMSVRLLRWQALRHMNMLETIAAAWRHNVADRDIIEEEFVSVLSAKPGNIPIEELRKAFGALPSLGMLIDELAQKNKKLEGKPPIG